MVEKGLTIQEKSKIFNIINEMENNYRFSEKWTAEEDLKVKKMRSYINNPEYKKPKQSNGVMHKFIGRISKKY